MIIFSPVGGWLADRAGAAFPPLPARYCSPSGRFPSASVQTTAVEVVPSNAVGQAAGLFSTMRYLGSIIGSSGMAAVLAATVPSLGSFRLLFAALFLSACAAVVSAARLPRWSGAG